MPDKHIYTYQSTHQKLPRQLLISRIDLPLRPLPADSGFPQGRQPLTLQGLWNDNVRPAWDSKYTVNINTHRCPIDNQLALDLFHITCSAADILKKTDDPLVTKMKHLAKRLPPMQIGQYGQHQEWLWDWDSPHEA
ncbi:MAG: hypothetical protein RR303_03875 [Bacteroidales bacterium]